MMKLWARLVLAGSIGLLVLTSVMHHANAQRQGALTITRIYTGPDGLAHAEEIDMKLMPRPDQEQSEFFKTVGARFVRAKPSYFQDWHTTPRRQYLITISGHSEIEVAGGQKVQLVPGRILLVEDTTGKGHRSRVVGTEDRV